MFLVLIAQQLGKKSCGCCLHLLDIDLFARPKKRKKLDRYDLPVDLLNRLEVLLPPIFIARQPKKYERLPQFGSVIRECIRGEFEDVVVVARRGTIHQRFDLAGEELLKRDRSAI